MFNDENPRFWMLTPEQDNVDDILTDWVGIVDETAGGVVAYCHPDNFDKVVSAFSN